jgi:hypothetical protein
MIVETLPYNLRVGVRETSVKSGDSEKPSNGLHMRGLREEIDQIHVKKLPSVADQALQITSPGVGVAADRDHILNPEELESLNHVRGVLAQSGTRRIEDCSS